MTGDTGGTGIDTTVPHPARIWNYWLRGQDTFAVDRLAGEQTITVLPEIVDIARASRGFLARVVGTWPPTPGSASSWRLDLSAGSTGLGVPRSTA
jgi:hypothetical protein